ncbi:MAG: hypothetical protein ACXWKG_13040 [Limisphaerales bacterium]
MTTVRFLMRWFYDKSAQAKPRIQPARAAVPKTEAAPMTNSESPPSKRKFGNPVRWHI